MENLFRNLGRVPPTKHLFTGGILYWRGMETLSLIGSSFWPRGRLSKKNSFPSSILDPSPGTGNSSSKYLHEMILIGECSGCKPLDIRWQITSLGG